jgi:hypothetical protein
MKLQRTQDKVTATLVVGSAVGYCWVMLYAVGHGLTPGKTFVYLVLCEAVLLAVCLVRALGILPKVHGWSLYNLIFDTRDKTRTAE